VRRCITAGLYRVPFVALLAYACGEVSSLEVQSPGTPGGPAQFKADLVPGPIEAPERMSLDESLQMRVGVRNIGNRLAGPGWTVRVFLSQDSSISPADTQIDQFVTTRDLPADGEDIYLRNKKLSGLQPGHYYLGSVVDVTDVVPELSDSNNTLVTPTSIMLLPEAPEP
jgi:CARDB